VLGFPKEYTSAILAYGLAFALFSPPNLGKCEGEECILPPGIVPIIGLAFVAFAFTVALADYTSPLWLPMAQSFASSLYGALASVAGAAIAHRIELSSSASAALLLASVALIASKRYDAAITSLLAFLTSSAVLVILLIT